MGDAGGQLTQRGHFLGLDQIGLCCLQVTVGGFSGVPSRSDFGFRSLALGDVSVDQHKPTIGHRIAADLDHPTIRPCSFEPQFLVRVFEATVEFRLDVVDAKFATFGEDTEVVRVARMRG
jgi:hypothetical protein